MALMDAMPPCPYAKPKAQGAHCLSVIVPEDAAHPATLFCDKCGMTKAFRVDFPMPVDDMVAEAIRYATRSE